MIKSKLYNLTNKRKLATLLSVSYLDIKDILKDKSKYFRFFEKDKRAISHPIGKLEQIHKKLFFTLRDTPTPFYLISGKRHIFYKHNAMRHRFSSYMQNYDIKKFYNNCDKEYIFKFFRNDLKMSDDVAWTITDLCHYNNCIPTGSPCSQLLAFFSYKKMFDEIYDLSKKYSLVFTVYVDDLTFSSKEQLPKILNYRLNQIIKKYGHKLNKKKTKSFSSKKHNLVTGCGITPTNEIKIKNSLGKDIVKSYNKLRKVDYTENVTLEEIKSYKTLRGKVNSARQIEEGKFNHINLWLSKNHKILKSKGLL